ncbi:hypothetical protein MCOR27_008965 [Pyricularia oryzae]|uniref:MFS general substrate transporter n=2 Tax=Pyricularia TaxID=48558 RepID=A0ABQ8NIJ8_PYRGI|nr:hypothetical protein MCOR01_010532 [Pyricularia oryzae]KAI6297691.1 hypothetical protein MCOR33_006020 [Pyricularia grisea]KAH9438478.1 hypothetical protein MCOR02_002099 [Pyricularia oryzae]KAI6254460.1 hypothetical protein MCOR19_009023 [Pyricularia oryzae]KAI6265336.1 hypothetical protein MCOR26_010793 [Pyricularia oryzae]
MSSIDKETNIEPSQQHVNGLNKFKDSDGAVLQESQSHITEPDSAELRDHADGHGGGFTRSRISIGAAIHDGRPTTAPDGSTVFYKVYKRRWFGVIQLTLLNIITSWDWLTFAPVPASSAAYFQVTESEINWYSTATLLCIAASAPVVIYTLRHGPKPAIFAASALVLAGNWIRYGGSRASSGSYGIVMFGQILIAIAQALVLASPARYSDLWFTDRGRVAATAVMSLANAFGAALGSLIIPFMVEAPEDVPNMLLWLSVIATVCSITGFFVPAAPPTPVAASSETPKEGLISSLRIVSRSPEAWMVMIPFAVYVGLFDAISSLLAQMMVPHGYSEDDSGIGAAVLIVVGLVAAAVSSPVIDRTKAFVLSVKVCIPFIALSYLVFIWMPETRPEGGIAGPYVVLAILGATSFALLPVALELLVEFTHPISPEVTSTFAWAGGQLLGGCFILIGDALKEGPEGNPPGNMKRMLIFQAVVALVGAIPPLCLGLFGRGEKIRLRRVASDVRTRQEDTTA